MDAEGGECWPWTRQYVQNGDMERSFLRYLLTTDPQLRALGAENKISVILVSIYNDTRFTVILYFPFFFPLIDLTASVPPLPHPPHPPPAAAAFPDSFSFSSSLSTSFSSSSRPLLHLLLISSLPMGLYRTVSLKCVQSSRRLMSLSPPLFLHILCSFLGSLTTG